MPSPQTPKQLIQTLLCWMKKEKRAFCHQHFVATVAQSIFFNIYKTTMPKETTTLRHQKIQQVRSLRKKAFTLWDLLQNPRKPALIHLHPLQQHRQHPRKRLLLKVPNKFLSLDTAMQVELTLFHKIHEVLKRNKKHRQRTNTVKINLLSLR